MRIKQVVSEPSFKYFLIGFVVLVGLTATTIYAAGRFMPPKDDKVALSDQNNQNNQDGQQQAYQTNTSTKDHQNSVQCAFIGHAKAQHATRYTDDYANGDKVNCLNHSCQEAILQISSKFQIW